MIARLFFGRGPRLCLAILLVSLCVSLCGPLSTAYASAGLYDSFTRADNTALGTTEDASQWAWQLVPGSDPSQIASDQLKLSGYNDGAGCWLYVGANASGAQFQPADMDAIFTAQRWGGTLGQYYDDFGIQFRMSGTYIWDSSYYAGVMNPQGYAVYPVIASSSDATMIILDYATWNYTTVDLPVDWSAAHTFRVKAVGTDIKVWLDSIADADTPVADYSFPAGSYTGPGNVGFWAGANGDSANPGGTNFDNISITALNAGAISGTVTSSVAPHNPLAGVEVRLSTSVFTMTNASGNFSFPFAPAGSANVSFNKAGYDTRTVATTVPSGGSVSLPVQLTADPVTPLATAADTFTRDDNTDLGVTEVGGYTWAAGSTEAYASITSDAVDLLDNVADGYPQTGFGLSDLQAADLDLSCTVRIVTSEYAWTGINYRATTVGDIDYGSYYLLIWPLAGGYYELELNNAGVPLGIVYTNIDFSSAQTVRIRAIGIHHQVFVNGNLMLALDDTSAASKTAAGYISFDRAGPETIFDNVSLNTYTPAPAGHVVGTVRKSTGEPVGGVTVYRNFTPAPGMFLRTGGASTVTAADGTYSFGDENQPRVYTVWTLLDGYTAAPAQVISEATGTVTNDITLTAIPSPSATAADTFTRANSANLGSTETTGGLSAYPWIKGVTEPSGSITGDALTFGTGSVGTGASLGGFYPVDVDITTDMTFDVNNPHVGICYRSHNFGSMDNNPGYAGQGFCGYLLYARFTGEFGLARPGAGVTGWAGVSTDWTVPHRVRVKAQGPHHQVWLDAVTDADTPVIDVWDYAGIITGGTVGLIRSNGTAKFDNFTATRLSCTETSSIGVAKAATVGSNVSLTGCVVTGQYTGDDTNTFFYVENMDRSAGIKVVTDEATWENYMAFTFNVGDVVSVYGTTAVQDGETYIDATGAQSVGTVAAIKPVGTNGKAIATDQGLSTVGLLVTAWGEVKSASGTTFTIDDGSGNVITVLMSADATLPTEGDYAVCTGNVGMQGSGAVLRMRSATDLTTY